MPNDTPKYVEIEMTKIMNIQKWYQRLFNDNGTLKPKENYVYKEFQSFMLNDFINVKPSSDEDLKYFLKQFKFEVLKEIVGPLYATIYIQKANAKLGQEIDLEVLQSITECLNRIHYPENSEDEQLRKDLLRIIQGESKMTRNELYSLTISDSFSDDSENEDFFDVADDTSDSGSEVSESDVSESNSSVDLQVEENLYPYDEARNDDALSDIFNYVDNYEEDFENESQPQEVEDLFEMSFKDFLEVLNEQIELEIETKPEFKNYLSELKVKLTHSNGPEDSDLTQDHQFLLTLIDEYLLNDSSSLFELIANMIQQTVDFAQFFVENKIGIFLNNTLDFPIRECAKLQLLAQNKEHTESSLRQLQSAIDKYLHESPDEAVAFAKSNGITKIFDENSGSDKGPNLPAVALAILSDKISGFLSTVDDRSNLSWDEADGLTKFLIQYNHILAQQPDAKDYEINGHIARLLADVRTEDENHPIVEKLHRINPHSLTIQPSPRLLTTYDSTNPKSNTSSRPYDPKHLNHLPRTQGIFKKGIFESVIAPSQEITLYASINAVTATMNPVNETQVDNVEISTSPTPVYAPSSGQEYSFSLTRKSTSSSGGVDPLDISLHDTIGETKTYHHARLDINTITDDTDKNKKLALTIMNMIENIVSRSPNLKVKTNNPLAAAIAHVYYKDYLEAEIPCHYQNKTFNRTPTRNKSELESQAKTILNDLIPNKAKFKTDIAGCPWYQAALDVRPDNTLTLRPF